MHRILEKAIDLQNKNKNIEAKKIYLENFKNFKNKDKEISYINLGNIFFLEKNIEQALEFYNKAKKLNDKNPKLYFNMAMIYLEKNELESSIQYFRKAILLDENYVSAYINLAIILKRIDALEESCFYFEKALSLDNKNSDIYYNYANTFLKKDEHLKTLYYLDKADELGFEDKSKILYTKGLIYKFTNNYKEALELFYEALKYNKEKDHANIYFAIATVQLLLGDFKNGWLNYEARWEAKNDLKRPVYPVPWYKGQDLKNKIVLVQQEQGFGDNIQFIRYLEALSKDAKKIYFAVRSELHKLFFKSFPNIDIISNDAVVDNVDYFVSLMDLPRIFYKKQDLFLQKEKYLIYEKEDTFKVKNQNKLNIGFSFRGNPDHLGDKKRNIPLNDFAYLFKNKKCDFYCLQYEYNDEILTYMEKYENIHNCKPYINNFNDTSNIVSSLDLVITIDSSLVHLCGALGVKTYLLLGDNSEWRWLLNTDKSIWYTSIKIFRKNLEPWSNLIRKVNNNL